jgi:hypothetical protein
MISTTKIRKYSLNNDVPVFEEIAKGEEFLTMSFRLYAGISIDTKEIPAEVYPALVEGQV